ncbi:MAG: cob(I)yrinic acid a,c-diamide adenosyltransferase [bacterium]
MNENSEAHQSPDRSTIVRRGRLIVFTGDGKGKTTAALGLALRAAGHRMHVQMLQFLKAEQSGELEAAAMLHPYLEIHQVGAGFVFPNRPEDLPLHRAAALRGLDLARRSICSLDWQILILDEIFPAIAYGLLSLEEVLILIGEKPPGLHLILTGRDAPKEIMEVADTVSEIHEVKHGWRQGIAAGEGIEF